MAGGELTGTNGTVVWDGIGTLRIRYDGAPAATDPVSSSLRARLGERVVPVEALQGVEVDDSEFTLVLREGADPLQAVTGGCFGALIQPYVFPFTDHEVAERIAQDIRRTLVRRDVPTTPAPRWLVAPPVAPDRIEGRDAKLSVASGELTFAYKGSARRKKKALGNPWSVALDEVIDVEWSPGARRGTGYLRVSTARTPLERPKPKHDPAAMVIARGAEVDALFFAARLLTRIRP